MARTRTVGLILLCLMASALPAEAQRESVWTVYSSIDATIFDSYAMVQVIADIGNRGPDPEFPFEVRVPDDAFVTGLTIERDGEVHEARIEERDRARQEYEEHKAEELTGGLVERRGSSTYAFLVNVAEFESVRATLTYEVALQADAGVYTLPVEAPVSGFGQDLGASFDVRISSQAGVTNAWGSAGEARPSGQAWHLHHSVGPRPDDGATQWSAHYTLAATPDGGDLQATAVAGQGYFAHRFRAPADEQQMPVDMVLVLDVSGSMGGQKIEQLRDAAIQVVQQLDDADRLHITFFSSSVQQPWQGLQPATAARRAEALDSIENIRAAGSTNMEAGLRSGLQAMEPDDLEQLLAAAGQDHNVPLLVFLTDGQATAGARDPTTLRELAGDAQEHGARVFSLAFGSDADWSLVAGLARDGGGLALRVPEGIGAEVDLERFMAALTTPALRDVAISYQGQVQSFSTTADLLFVGSELLVVGTMPSSMARLMAEVTAHAADGPRAYDVDVPIEADASMAHLARLYAYSRIQDLQQRIAADGERADWVDEIVDLAMDHGFVTDYTSLVLTLAPRARPVEETQWDDWEGDAAPASDSASGGSSRPVSSSATGDPAESADSSDGAHGGRPMVTPGHGSNPEHTDPAEDADTPLPAWLLLVALGAAVARRRFE